MLLTLPIILGVFSLMSSDSARNIYSRIIEVFDPAGIHEKDLPDIFSGRWFFGFRGVTKEVLIKTIEVLHETAGWVEQDADNATRNIVFANISNLVAQATDCDPEGVRKWCTWCFVAAKYDKSIYNYFANPTAKYTVIDKVKDAIADTVTETTEEVKERVDLAVSPTTTTTARINPLLKWAIIGGVAFFAYKKIFK